MRRILLLSGPTAIGKTAISTELRQDYGFDAIRSSPHLKDMAKRDGLPDDRTTLQNLGDRLDAETDYAWVVDAVAAPTILAESRQHNWLFDSVRKERQVEWFRKKFGTEIWHVALCAPEAFLRQRYELRMSNTTSDSERTPYDVVVKHPNEQASRRLIDVADFVVDVQHNTANELARRIIDNWGKRNV